MLISVFLALICFAVLPVKLVRQNDLVLSECTQNLPPGAIIICPEDNGQLTSPVYNYYPFAYALEKDITTSRSLNSSGTPGRISLGFESYALTAGLAVLVGLTTFIIMKRKLS